MLQNTSFCSSSSIGSHLLFCLLLCSHDVTEKKPTKQPTLTENEVLLFSSKYTLNYFELTTDLWKLQIWTERSAFIYAPLQLTNKKKTPFPVSLLSEVSRYLEYTSVLYLKNI